MAVKKMAEFMIVNRRSGKALQATGLDNGLVVEQATPVKSDAQTWRMEDTGEGVKLFNKAAAKVLDVMSGGTSNGTWTQTWEDVNGNSQFWQMVPVSPTYKKILHVLSGKALDVVDMSDEDGAPAQIWEDVGGENQQWKLVSLEEKTVTKTVRKTAVKKVSAEKEPPAKKTAATKAEPKAAPAPKAAAKASKAPAAEKVPVKKEPAKKASAKSEEVKRAEPKTKK